MAPISRRLFFNSAAAVGVAAEISLLTAGCASADEVDQPKGEDVVNASRTCKNPYDFGAVGDGVNDDSGALRSAYEAAVNEGGGTVELSSGRFHIPGNLEMNQPGVSLVGCGNAIIGGGEVRVGPSAYGPDGGGVDFSGSSVSNIRFDRGDDFGESRCLVLRNVRGLDVSSNVFLSAGKGVAVETADGNEKFHTTAMLRIAGNRFSKLTFGVFGDTVEWDRLSDWTITDNYFNYCSDTSVWIACTNGDSLGGVDGLNFAGNTIFSLNHNASEDPLFASKRYNLRVGRTNWLRINNNNFFEAGLSAVYLDTTQHFTFVGNHVAWPGQRELSDALEFHNGKPVGVVEGNTFALWTRAAIGFYNLSDLTQVEIGTNAWNWSGSPDSWTGSGDLPGYRIYATGGGNGYPTIRDFQVTGAHDNINGDAQLQSRDIKSTKGGVAGASRRSLEVSEPTAVFSVSDIRKESSFGGLISMTVTNSPDESLVDTYLLFVSAKGSVCTVVESGGGAKDEESNDPRFEWSLSDGKLQAVPVGSTEGSFNFDATCLGAVLLT